MPSFLQMFWLESTTSPLFSGQISRYRAQNQVTVVAPPLSRFASDPQRSCTDVQPRITEGGEVPSAGAPLQISLSGSGWLGRRSDQIEEKKMDDN